MKRLRYGQGVQEAIMIDVKIKISVTKPISWKRKSAQAYFVLETSLVARVDHSRNERIGIFDIRTKTNEGTYII